MKICMYSIDRVFDKGTGGVRRFLELAVSLKNQKHDVYLYSADDTDIIRKNGFMGHTIMTSKEAGKSMIGLKSAFKNRKLFAEIKKLKFDRFVVFDIRAAFAPVLNGVKNIYLFLRQDMLLYKKIQLNDSNANYFKKKLILFISRLKEGFCLYNAKKIVVQCNFDLSGLIRRHALLKNNIKNKSIVQINNINPCWVEEKSKDIPVTDEKKYDLSFIGNFKDYRKGHKILLKAIKQLTDEGFKIHCAIIGDGKHLEECKKQYADYDNIEFLGRLDNPLIAVNNSRLLVVPSYVDSCPNTVLEGLYCKVPVIGSDRSGIPEILNNNNWLFNLDVISLKNKIKSSLDTENNILLAQQQLKRREELIFDWGLIMTDIVVS